MSRCFTKWPKVAESIVLVIDVVGPVKGLEGRSSQDEFLVALNGSEVWSDLAQNLVVVVPIG